MKLILIACGTQRIFIQRATFAARRAITDFQIKKLVLYVTQIKAYFNKLCVFTILKTRDAEKCEKILK